MDPIDPAELSAYLDGELSAKRAEEVRAALARDPMLRKSYDQLAALDADCKSRAAAAMFRPRVQLTSVAAPRDYLTAAGVIGLLLIRLALKATPPLLGTVMAALLLALFIGWGLRRLVHATDSDCKRFMLAADS
jgi:anti-sigma factor RsiW